MNARNNTIEIATLAEYIQAVDGLLHRFNLHYTTTTPWFRGHGDVDWNMVPSVFRIPNLHRFERDIIRDFKLMTRSLLQHDYPKDDFEWLFLMQHYGLPTRLLDWSESSLVGLFFATENRAHRGDGVVYVLSSRIFNWYHLKDTNTVPVTSSPYLANHILKPDNGPHPTRSVTAEFPLALRPPRNSERISAQRGTFTIHGRQPICLKSFVGMRIDGHEIMEAITVKGSSKSSILKELYQCGISHSVLFPELPGVSQELMRRYTEFYTP